MPVIVVRGEVDTFESVEEALRSGKLREGDVIIVVEGRMAVLRVEGGLARLARAGTGAEPQAVEAGPGRAALVFDQMFRGFADILVRELPANFEMHEIVGRGLEKPVRVGRISKWPARDDYDVLKVVETLAGRYDKVVFFTGDKKLAGQASALGLPNVVVEYMPPNEYPGKESLAKAMIKAAREAAS